MNRLDGFKESSDVNDINKDHKLEITLEAQNKFEQIMGDTKLPETISSADKEKQSENLSVTPFDKFEGLFESNCNFPIEPCENTTDMSAEVKADNYRFPRSGGEWSGEPGNSEWEPDSDTIPGDRNGTNPDDKTWKEIKNQYDFDTISFEDGRPDFSEVSKGNVEIENFSDNRRKNFVQADEKLAEQKGCQPSEVRQWRTENKYTWHEESDCKTMRKVPSEVHGNIPHDGGISEMKNQKDGQEMG